MKQVLRVTPSSAMTQVQQIMASTSLESMVYARIKPNNLDSILAMIRDHSTAAHQLLSSNPQLKSLEDTYKVIKEQLEKKEIDQTQSWGTKMSQLVEVIKEMRRKVFISFCNEFLDNRMFDGWRDLEASILYSR